MQKATLSSGSHLFQSIHPWSYIGTHPCGARSSHKSKQQCYLSGSPGTGITSTIYGLICTAHQTNWSCSSLLALKTNQLYQFFSSPIRLKGTRSSSLLLDCWGFLYIYIHIYTHTHTYLFLDVKYIRGIQGRDTSVCLTHHPVSFHPPVSVWPWKGPTFQPGASQQLTNLFPQKNEAALGNCAHWERKIAPQAITNAMWAWGCWNWSLHSDPASKQRALPANSGEAACHSYCQRFPGQYLLIENC